MGLGSATTPPTPPSAGVSKFNDGAPLRDSRGKTSLVATHSQISPSDSEDNDPAVPEFNSWICPFCEQESRNLSDNMTHMATAHSFKVPFQDFLAVDLDTVLEYLHFIIYGYRECICCGTRRSTVEGAQQHMVAKGHCRFDISSDTEDFYEIPRPVNDVVWQTQRDGNMSVRLSSGKLISNRKDSKPHERRPAPRRETPDRRLDPSYGGSNNPSGCSGLEVARQQERNNSGEIVLSNEAILAAQLSRLKIAGVRAQHKEEGKRRWRLERGQNAISLKRFRLDAADGRMGRQF